MKQLELTQSCPHTSLYSDPHISVSVTLYSCIYVCILQVVTHEIQDRHCCAVCLDLLYEPFKCSCNHVFCDPCLRQLNFRIGRNGTISCPLCRQTVEHVTPATGTPALFVLQVKIKFR